MSEAAQSQGSIEDPISGRKYHYSTWMPKTPRSCIVIIHGFGEHGGRYRTIAEWLSGKGIFVIIPDLWGHGRSGGERGDLGDLAQAVGELSRLAKKLLSLTPNLKQYNLYGHSFGGLMAIMWAINNTEIVARTIIQSPLLETGFKVPVWKEIIASLCALLWPSMTIPMGLDINQLSQNRDVVAAYLKDPLVHNRMSARTYKSMRTYQRELPNLSESYLHPLLLLCGKSDKIISIQAAIDWYESISSHKRMVLFEGCFHELHNEPVRNEVLTLIDDWI